MFSLKAMYHTPCQKLNWPLLALLASTALNAFAQNTLTNGLTYQGNLSSPTSAQSWTLKAQAGDHISLTVAKLTGGASFNPQLAATSPSGSFLGAASGTTAARLDLQADLSGTYTVSVTDAQQTGSGNYQLRLAQVPESFIVSTNDEGGPLTNGATHLGTITTGDLDMWTFTANAGERIVLQAAKLTGGAVFTPQLELFGPDGARLAANSAGTAVRVDAQAPSKGTYTVIVSALSPDGTGTYQLQFFHVLGPLIIPAGDEGGPLTDGVAQNGTITVGDLDPWTFTANVGDKVSLQLTKVSGGATFTPQLELFGPSGERRNAGQGSTGTTFDTLIDVPGTYVALVSDAGQSGAGTYTLNLSRVTLTLGSSLLINGTNVQATISSAGQTNTWNLAASANDRIILRVGKVGTGSFNPWLRLLNPNGVLLGSSSTASATEIAVTATNTGSFTVLISDGSVGHNQTGSYRLSLARPGTALGTGPLTNGLATTGSIALGSLDVWTFTANSGESLAVRMGELTPNSTLTPYLRLYGPDATLLAAYGVSSTAAEVAVRATNSGTFTVVATDNSSLDTGTGGYRLKLAKTGSPIALDPNDEGGALTNGVTQAGDIVIGDLDLWNFTAEAGQTIVVRMGKLLATSTLTPYLRLWGPDGAFLAQYGVSGTAAEVSVRATNSGTFTIVASDLSSLYTGSGTYQVKLAKTGSAITLGPNDNGGAMTNGTMYTGNISIGGMEIWNFDATEGDSMVVRMGKLVPNAILTPYLRLLGPDGTLLSQYGISGTASEVSVRATNSGTFTVIAADLSSLYTGSGTYRLKLGMTADPVVILPTDEGGPLTNGWMHTGSIDIGDMDVWTFHADAEQNIVVRMGKLVANSTLTPYLRLFDPSGALLNSYGVSGSASEVSARATNSGTFTVIAADLSSLYSGSGTYRLKLAKTSSPLLIQANDTGGALTGNTNYDGTLGVGDMDVWEFTACAGDPILLSLTKLVSTSTLTPWLRLFNRDGALLKSVSGANPQVTMAAPASGTYTVVVADLSSLYTGSGTYQLSVNGLLRTLRVCPPDVAAGDTNVIVAGAQVLNGFTLLTSTNVDTPKVLWAPIPASQFDTFGNLTYPATIIPGEDRRFFRWLGP